MLPDCHKDEKDLYRYKALRFFILLCKEKFHLCCLDSHELSHYLKLPSFLSLLFFFLPIQKSIQSELSLTISVIRH